MKRCIGLLAIVLLSGPLAALGQSAEFRDSRLRLKIELTYDPSGYSIRYLDSVHLLYKEREPGMKGGTFRVIHKNYNIWIRQLASAINNSLGVPVVESKLQAGR
jgi:hypothetical protein